MPEHLHIRNLYDRWREGAGASWSIDNPADAGQVTAQVRGSSQEDIETAVATASGAFPAWSRMPVVKRCRILMRIKEALEAEADALAELLVRENGKTLAEAKGDIRRGIEVVEFAAGMPSLMKGDYLNGIAHGFDGYLMREPLGVVAGVCPYNFPAMIPLWMIPVALACGNCFVLKPSETCPCTATRIAEIFVDKGLPPGVLCVLQGDRTVAEALLDHPAITALSFVGSTPAAQAVWQRGTRNGKRVQALGGAKNRVILMPDADRASAVSGIVSSSFGCAGQRCMAASVLITVGQAADLLPEIIETAGALTIGDGLDSRTQLGPLISAAHKQRVEQAIADAVDAGAKLLLDGRGRGPQQGHFVGATVLETGPDAAALAREIFGPVLCVQRAESLDEAIEFTNASRFGNGATIFTGSGAAARRFRDRVECGMLGINAGVPAPMAFFSFGGRKASFFGDLRAHGTDGIEFYTQKKSVIECWPGEQTQGSIW